MISPPRNAGAYLLKVNAGTGLAAETGAWPCLRHPRQSSALRLPAINMVPLELSGETGKAGREGKKRREEKRIRMS